MPSPMPYEFVCIDCKTPVTRWGPIFLDEATNQRCCVCYFIHSQPDMDEAMKQKLLEWGNGGGDQRKDTLSIDTDALLSHTAMLGKPKAT